MTRIVALAAILLFSFSSTVAIAGSQQDKMTACNEEASKKGLKADERKAFMSQCLSAKPAKAESKPNPQQEKMKACNKEAGEKKFKGDERKNFMSNCLKG